MDQRLDSEHLGSIWNSLYLAGAWSALLAGLIFRRNLGVEISLFSIQKQPATVQDVFLLLQSNRLLGLIYLNVFDVVNYILVGVTLLALFILLRRISPGWMALAAGLGGLGIAVYAASNTALSMLSLSDQYAAATTVEQKNLLLAAGQALQALSRFSSPGAQPGSGGFLSLLLVALSGLIVSVVMLRNGTFSRVAAVVGLVANGLDLTYCLAFAFVPGVDRGLLAVTFIPVAGLFFMVWHVLIGIRLWQCGRMQVGLKAAMS